MPMPQMRQMLRHSELCLATEVDRVRDAYFICGSTVSNAWRRKAFSSASASTSSDSVNTSGGLRLVGGVQPTGCSTATSSLFRRRGQEPEAYRTSCLPHKSDSCT